MIVCTLRASDPLDLLHAYRVAGLTLAADEPLTSLAPFLQPLDGHSPTTDTIVLGDRSRKTGLIHRGTGWIANDWRELSAWWNAGGYRLAIAGVGEFAVLADGGTIGLLAKAPGVGRGTLEQVLLGPPLILALALRGIWCLHAGAVTCGTGVSAIAGESGQGKSTLAANLDQQRDSACRRVSDDILPAAHAIDGPVALPHFPQLKLPAQAQYPPTAPRTLPLKAVYLLDPRPGDDRAPTAASALEGRSLTAELLRHTVANLLFTPDLLRQHLEFCSELTEGVKGYRLSFPKRWSALPELRRLMWGGPG